MILRFLPLIIFLSAFADTAFAQQAESNYEQCLKNIEQQYSREMKQVEAQFRSVKNKTAANAGYSGPSSYLDAVNAVGSKYTKRREACSAIFYREFGAEVLKEQELEAAQNLAEKKRQQTFLNKNPAGIRSPTQGNPNLETTGFSTPYYPGISFHVYEQTAKRYNGNIYEGLLSEDVRIPQHLRDGSGIFTAKRGTTIRFQKDPEIYSNMKGAVQFCTLRDAACLAQTENITVCLPPGSKVTFGIGWTALNYEMGATLTQATLGDGTSLKQWHSSAASGWQFNEQEIYFNKGTHIRFYNFGHAKPVANINYVGAVQEAAENEPDDISFPDGNRQNSNDGKNNSEPAQAFTGQQHYEKGEQLYKLRDYAAAVRQFRFGAQQGNADAQYELGHMYSSGTGVKENTVLANVWYMAAAAAGNYNAQWALGYHYDKGYGIEQDDSKAVYWYQKAVNNQSNTNNTCALLYLANKYFHGQGVAQNYATAFSLYSKTRCTDVNMLMNMGYMYENGLGTVKDPGIALDKYRTIIDDPAQYSKSDIALARQAFDRIMNAAPSVVPTRITVWSFTMTWPDAPALAAVKGKLTVEISGDRIVKGRIVSDPGQRLSINSEFTGGKVHDETLSFTLQTPVAGIIQQYEVTGIDENHAKGTVKNIAVSPLTRPGAWDMPAVITLER